MFSFVLGAVAGFGLVAAGDQKGQSAQALDGAWTVVCYEKDGQPQADAKGMAVKAENGTLTCAGRDGKPAITLKVACGPNGTVRVTEMGADAAAPAADAKAGVFVRTGDYLAISVNADARPGEARDGAKPDQDAKPRCTLLLRREGKGDEK